jgi:hypothetical protein
MPDGWLEKSRRWKDDQDAKKCGAEAISGLLNSEDLALNSGSGERHRMGVAFKPEQAKDF